MAGEHARRRDRIARSPRARGFRRAPPRLPPPARRRGEAVSADRRRATRWSNSSPTAHGPASSTSATLSPSCSMTCSARVGLSRPERLAEGAASAPPKAAITSCAGPRGARSAIVASPAVASGWTGASGASGTTSDSGPGQNFSRKPLGARIEHAIAPRHRDVGHMADQRIEARPALGREDARHRLAVGGVGGEAVDRLGRQRDQLAAPQRVGGIARPLRRDSRSVRMTMAHARLSPAGGGASSVGV